MSPEEFAKFIKAERERWGGVVGKAGLKAESSPSHSFSA